MLKITAIYRRVMCAIFAIPAIINSGIVSFASSVSTSKIATGTQQLIQDATTWLLIIAPIAGTVAIVYFAIRRGMADEQEQKQWQNRIIVAIVSVAIAVLASVIINLVTSYYA